MEKTTRPKKHEKRGKHPRYGNFGD